MPPTDPPRVVVLGGGPAGAVAAKLLAGWGHPTTLLTRPAPHRALAESLPPSSTRLLEHVGVLAAVEDAGFVRSTGNTVWWGSEEARQEPFGGGVTGFQVDRTRFDRLLLAQAQAAGAVIRRRATVRDVREVPGGGGLREVRYDEAGRSRSITAIWVLDCTGRAGLLARRGWRTAVPGLRTTALVAAWDHPGGWPLDDFTHTLVESYAGGWAWSVPLSRTRRHVTVMVDPTLTTLAGKGRMGTAYREELAKTGRIGALLGSARQVGRPWARDASPYGASTVAAPGLLLVGDAASFSDPLSSFGIKKALASAWMAAVVVRSSLDNPAIAAAALELYTRRERAAALALRSTAAAFSRDVASSLGSGFWSTRAEADITGPGEDPDVRLLREDPAVRAALAELQRRETMVLKPGAAARRAPRPAVRNDRIITTPHLILPAFPTGIRWLRDIDLIELAELAVQHEQVPELLEAFSRSAGAVPLPDFLGALAVLIAKGALDFA